jgi:hypothetical protein
MRRETRTPTFLACPLGGHARKEDTVKRHLPRVIYHREYNSIRRVVLDRSAPGLRVIQKKLMGRGGGSRIGVLN